MHYSAKGVKKELPNTQNHAQGLHQREFLCYYKILRIKNIIRSLNKTFEGNSGSHY